MSAQDYVKGRQDGREMVPHAVPYAHPDNHYQRGFNDGLADVKREADHPRKAFTVFGVWYKDEAVSVAVVEGTHRSALTRDIDSLAKAEELDGSWAVFVQAETAEEAERKATTETGNYDPLADLTAADPDEDEGRSLWPEHRNQLGDWCPWSGTPVQAGDEVCPAMCPSSADDYDPDDDDEEESEEG